MTASARIFRAGCGALRGQENRFQRKTEYIRKGEGLCVENSAFQERIIFQESYVNQWIRRANKKEQNNEGSISG